MKTITVSRISKLGMCNNVFLQTLLNDCFSSNVCDREHGIKYVTEKEGNTAINYFFACSLSATPKHMPLKMTDHRITQTAIISH